jgi:putative addiction module component (TIGR02574 family)
MIPNQLTESVLALPEEERLELARRIVESVTTERRVSELVAEGVRRIEDVVSGKTRGLSEEEYRRAVE